MRVAIIGAGKAGRDFAVLCAASGVSVVLEDVMPEKLRRVEAVLAQLTGPHGTIELVTSVEDAVRDADIVIDFVPDELESKLEIWSMIDRMAPPKTIMCTPSQTLSITDLASCTYRQDRCIMTREPEAGQTLRLLTATWTSPTTVAMVTGLLTQLAFEVSSEHDPDLPMLLKNMNAPTLV